MHRCIKVIVQACLQKIAFVQLYRPSARSEMERSEIELAWRQKGESKEQACLQKIAFVQLYRASARSEMERSEIELAWRQKGESKEQACLQMIAFVRAWCKQEGG